MSVIRHQRPCIARNIFFRQKLTDTFEKIIAILIVFEDVSTFDTPNNNMMKNPGGV